jgi:hypothetical protein
MEITEHGADSSVKQRKQDWIQCWKKLSQEMIQAWIKRIPEHIEKVIIACGGGNEYRVAKGKVVVFQEECIRTHSIFSRGMPSTNPSPAYSHGFWPRPP